MLANELMQLNAADELPISVIRVWPNFPNEFSYLSMEAELDDGATVVSISEFDDGYELVVSRWIFGDCWDTYRERTATLLGAWQRVYEFLHPTPIVEDLPEWAWDDLPEWARDDDELDI